MEHILRLLKRHGVTDVVSTLWYLSESIIATFGDGSDLGLNLIHSLETTPLGTAGAVKLAEAHLKGDTIVIISGDALTSLDLTKALAWHREKGSMATLVLKRVPNPLEFGVVITDEESRIVRFLEKPGWSQVFSDTVNTGIYILEPEVLDLMESGVNTDWSQDIFPKMLANNAPLFGYVTEEYWSDIGSHGQYMEAQADILGGRTGLEMAGVQIQPGIWVGDDTVIESGVTFRAPVCLGSGVRVKTGAVLGPNTVVGDSCIIEADAELDTTVAWEGAYLGQGVQSRGAIICANAIIKKDTVLREDVVVGDNTRIDVSCFLKAGVKVWPDRDVERGSTLTMSLVSGSRWRQSLFRDLGVAGISNIEVTPEFATRLGLAYGTTLPMGARVITSRDSSRSSRMTKRAIIASLLSTGATVVDMRSSPLPITRHHVRAIGAHGALNVRKMPGSSRLTLMEVMDGHGRYVSPNQQRKIESNFYREEFRRTDPDELGVIDLASRAVELYEHDFLKGLSGISQLRHRRVVVDYGYSSIAPIFPQILHKLDVEVISLNAVNDAKKAPRTGEEIDAHLRSVAQIASTLRADLGVLFINEGERMMLVDDRGVPLSGHQLLGSVASLIAQTQERPEIALSITTPSALVKHLEGLGAQCRQTKSGVRNLMEGAEKAAFAGDENGGFILNTMGPGFDAMFAFASLLERLDRSQASLSEIAGSLPEFHVVHRRVPCSFDKKGLVMRIMAEELGSEGTVELTDGVKVWLDDAWALVLPDSFDAMVHVYAEGSTDGESLRIVNEIKERIDVLRSTE
jgi:mannose-1-phosphate guanylyltransferase/phosphomannomutase